MKQILFSETQKFRQLWLFALVGCVLGGSMAYLWWGWYHQVMGGVPFGNHPAPNGLLTLVVCLETLVCVLVGGLLLGMKLTVEADEEGLGIHFFPIKKLWIPYTAMEKVQARDYRPLREFGGWGVKRSWDGNTRSFTMEGNRGVEIFLRDGNRLFIGSQHSDELSGQMNRQLESSPRAAGR